MKTETIEKTMVWVRILSLNFVYHMIRVFCGLLHWPCIGIPVEVDLDALRVEHGKFARVYVKIDINKPVVRSVGINGEWYEVQYKDCVYASNVPAMAIVAGSALLDQRNEKAARPKECGNYSIIQNHRFYNHDDVIIVPYNKYSL
jgi:hypothetical protein